MSGATSSTSAQNLDLGALGDALGGVDDSAGSSKPRVGEDAAAYKIGDDDEDSKDAAEATKSRGPSLTVSQPEPGSDDAHRHDKDSPATLSPNSLRSVSPTAPIAPPAPPTVPKDRPSREPAAVVPIDAAAGAGVPNDHREKAKAIKGMFPSLDEESIVAVLAAEDGDEEAAVNVLLSMSDPSAGVAPPSAARRDRPSQAQSGVMSDEELARSLAMEEDEAYARATQAEEAQRRYARQQTQPGGRRGGGGAESGNSTSSGSRMLSEFFGGLSEPRSGSSGNGGGSRGGGGAASFFNELKQSVQPLFEGKGPLHKDSSLSRSLDHSGPSSGAGGAEYAGTPSYDPSQLTYQPRVKRGGGAGVPRSGTASSWSRPYSQQQQQQQWQRAAPQPNDPFMPPYTNPGRAQSAAQQGHSTTQAFQPIRILGGANDPAGNGSNSLGKARAVPAGAIPAAGLATGAALGAAGAANAESFSAPPASLASVMQDGGGGGGGLGAAGQAEGVSSGGTPRLGNDFDDEGDVDADDLDSDDLEFQKSPFDDED
ncbi:unnamed protein product [Parajaminaea phylloscopi]